MIQCLGDTMCTPCAGVRLQLRRLAALSIPSIAAAMLAAALLCLGLPVAMSKESVVQQVVVDTTTEFASAMRRNASHFRITRLPPATTADDYETNDLFLPSELLQSMVVCCLLNQVLRSASIEKACTLSTVLVLLCACYMHCKQSLQLNLRCEGTSTLCSQDMKQHERNSIVCRDTAQHLCRPSSKRTRRHLSRPTSASWQQIPHF
jgi:hypothetical protein